jgi:hypothetical protein
MEFLKILKSKDLTSPMGIMVVPIGVRDWVGPQAKLKVLYVRTCLLIKKWQPTRIEFLLVLIMMF